MADATMRYYDIAGATVAELRSSMDSLGPLDSSGRRSDTATVWSIDWTWPLSANDSCVLSEATTRKTITVTFPRWTPPPASPAALIEQWDAYQDALAEHETGHVRFVIAAAADVLSAIRGATCATAESAAQSVVQRIRQHDMDYDTDTDHGVAQDAHFP